MSEDEDTYCRLCAEPTPFRQLISIDDEVGVNSKITSKMLWINIDVSKSNYLPKTICFSCFDLLERTWTFLHNVKTAQKTLIEIFSQKFSNTQNIHTISEENVGKPVDKNWEEFSNAKTEVKSEVHLDDIDITENSINVTESIKSEPFDDSDKDMTCDNSCGSSTDSDLPLKLAAKKKKVKNKKKKRKYDEEILATDLIPNTTAEVLQLDMSLYTMTWDDYTWCCANCDAQCKTIDSFRLHSLEIHSQCCLFKCSDCGKIVTSYKSFINHVRLHYKTLRYYCEVCNKHCRMSALVKKHHNMVHRHDFSCRHCGSNFETEDLLQNHLLMYAKIFRKQDKLKKEKMDAELKCDLCNREFKSRSNLQAHKLVHTERSRDFSCHMCGKMFYTKGALSTHMATHEDTKPFKCEFCPLAFRARGNLTSHISLHFGAKPFVCEQCGKSFRVKRHLKSHSIVHTDLMPYVCEYCNKSFRFKTRLNLHIRQHTGAKPYTCIYCRRDFTNGSNYKKHMKRRHNIDTSVRKKVLNVAATVEPVENNAV